MKLDRLLNPDRVLTSRTQHRYTKTVADRTRRVFETHRPNTAGGVITTTRHFDSNGRLQKTTQPGLADRWQLYDSLGNPTISGTDIDASGALEQGSASDRYSVFESGYAEIDNHWWRFSKAQAADTANDNHLVTLSHSRSRLAPVAGEEAGQVIVSETVAFNPESPDDIDHATIQKTIIDRSAKTVTSTTEHAGRSNLTGTSTTINGLLKFAHGTTNHGASEFFYDGLERLVGYRDPRSGLRTTTHYSDSTGQVDYTIDLDGNTTKSTS